jgi:hypothetical protein
MSLNMHRIVRGAITAINEDTTGTVYLSTGRTNVRGILTATFAAVTAKLQVQAQRHDPLRHENGLNYTNSYYTVYAYGHFGDLARPDGTGGDVITFNNTWWYIDNVLEYWPGWASFEIVRQLNATDIANLLAQIKNGSVA